MSLLSLRILCRATVCALLGVTASALLAQTKPAPDVLIFTNGDQLTGKLERAVGGNVVFKSDMAGELTIPLDKVKDLHSENDFVALRSGRKPDVVAGRGQVSVQAGNVVITPKTGGAPEATLTPKELGYLIDGATYEKALSHKQGFLHGWAGTVTGGFTLVRSTDTSTTFTAATSLVRAQPKVPYLPARNRTAFNLTETFGKQTSPVVPPPPPFSGQAATATVLTSIFHADAERDEYFRPRLYFLADTSFDHNYAQGLQLQQVYGGGIGWTAIKSGKQELDLKVDAHYEKQQYFSTTPGVPATASTNLFGDTFSETYQRHLPHKLEFTENGTFLPAWNVTRDYSANVTGTLAMPVWKKLSATFTATDNYLNDPAVLNTNPLIYYNKNSVQFVTGVSYTLP